MRFVVVVIVVIFMLPCESKVKSSSSMEFDNKLRL